LNAVGLRGVSVAAAIPGSILAAAAYDTLTGIRRRGFGRQAAGLDDANGIDDEIFVPLESREAAFGPTLASTRDPVLAFRLHGSDPASEQDSFALNVQIPSIEWFPLLIIAASAAVMIFLVRRSMRGMNQQDWILLRKARGTGANLKLPQSVSFVVFAATEAVGAELAQKMRGEGFETTMKQAQIQYARNRNKPGAPQDGWLVSGTRSVLVVPETLTSIRKTLTEMALERKAVYLGWQLAHTVAALNANTPPSPASQANDQAAASERTPP
jgi:hypothetical protein